MDKEFLAAYKALNDKQKEAVDSVEGPLLVVAGPGTGKTQLLSLRVANILRSQDVSPANVLCLTFTDNAAQNMRERLQSVIGQSAYHVPIHTFHSFGSDVINQYPDFFSSRQLIQQIDELGRYELGRTIFEDLPHDNPLSTKVGSDFIFLKDTLSVISWLKQNALTPDELIEIIKANQAFIKSTSKLLADSFASTPSPKHLNEYQKLLKAMEDHSDVGDHYGFLNYGTMCASEFKKAIEATEPSARFAPLITAWRSSWCQKDASNQHVFKDDGRNYTKMLAVADVYRNLLEKMSQQGLYDFDDMIIEVVHALEDSPELRFSLQERYQFVLVDEFQDTNKAQLRMLSSLGDNPVHEGRPNIMAVGDDDQAIYAFQGAEASNMLMFSQMYRDTRLITLEDNYRSTERILDASFSIETQITDRLENILEGTYKDLSAKVSYKEDVLEHLQFVSELAQYDYVAEQIGSYIKKGTKPEQIAVIAPRHRYLERLMPYLGEINVPVAYERREDILDSPIIIQLITMTKLLSAIAINAQHEIDALLAEVLAYDFWGIDSETLLNISLEAYNKHEHWAAVAKNHKDSRTKLILTWFNELAKQSKLEPLEYILDQLIGGLGQENDDEFDDIMLPSKLSKLKFVSPMRNFYFSPERYDQATDGYLTLLGQLSTLRQRLRSWKPLETLYADDLVEFVNLHKSAGLKIIDTNPHTQTTNAVQVMTVYKAKGLEFEVVFVINAQDNVWGPTTRSRSSSIRLPANLPIAPASDGINDKLRLLFVALTRAKNNLILTSYQNSLNNKKSLALSFLINDQAEYIDPELAPKEINIPDSQQASKILTTDWAYRFRQIIADKPTLFEPILKNYKLSVTHLNNFLDVTKDGPTYFLSHNLLRFPEAIAPAAAYGDAVHKTLQWTHTELKSTGKLTKIEVINEYFSDVLGRKHLAETDFKKLNVRGQKALKLYFSKRADQLLASDILERGFNNEGVVINGANLSGKIDKLHFIDNSHVEVIDFKTGKPATIWQGKDDYEKVKLHKYRQQLLFYKLLIENSASFSNKLKASSGALEFIEASDQGTLVNNLTLEFDATEIDRFCKLIGTVWQHITSLNFPATDNYSKDFKGVSQFEQDLIDGLV